MNAIVLIAKVNQVEYTWKVDPSTVLYQEAARKGFQEWLQDAASTAKGKNAAGLDVTATLQDRMKAVKTRLDKIQNGTYTPGRGGGGGSRLSLGAEKAQDTLARLLQEHRVPGCTTATAAKKQAKIRSNPEKGIMDGWEMLTKQLVTLRVSAANPKMDTENLVKKIKGEMPEAELRALEVYAYVIDEQVTAARKLDQIGKAESLI